MHAMRPKTLNPARLASLETTIQKLNLSAYGHLESRSYFHLVRPASRPDPCQRLSLGVIPRVPRSLRSISYEQKAKDLNQQGVDDALSDFDTAVAEDREKQHRAPWHRQGVEEPPVRKQRSAGAMTKGVYSRRQRSRLMCLLTGV